MLALPPFSIELTQKRDVHNNIYHVGLTGAPVLLPFKQGVCFMAWTHISGAQMLNISRAKPSTWCRALERAFKEGGELEKLRAHFEIKYDKSKNPYYLSVVQDDNLILDLSEGYSFMVFTSVKEDEQLHIRKFIQNESARQEPEIIRRDSSKRLKAQPDVPYLSEDEMPETFQLPRVGSRVG